MTVLSRFSAKDLKVTANAGVLRTSFNKVFLNPKAIQNLPDRADKMRYVGRVRPDHIWMFSVFIVGSPLVAFWQRLCNEEEGGGGGCIACDP